MRESDFGPKWFDRLAQASQAKNQMIEKNLPAWLKKDQISQTLPDQAETQASTRISKLPKPIQKAAWAVLTFTGLVGLAATCARGSQPEPKEEEEPSQAKAGRELGLTRFLDLPFHQDQQMAIQQAWIGSDGKLHSGTDYIQGTIDNSSSWQEFPIWAAADGSACANPKNRVGNAVFIEHKVANTTFYTYYGHLKEINQQIPECSATKKLAVKKGQQLGVSGSTGLKNPRLVHLHFEVKNNKNQSVDPYDLRSQREDYPDPNFTNGKICGQNHLWVNCPTQPVAGITPQPPTETQDSIQILKENLERCRINPNSTELSEDFWGGWVVKADKEGFWINALAARIKLISPEGVVVKTIEIGRNVIVPESTPTWVIGTQGVGIGLRDIVALFVYSAEGSRVTKVEFEIIGYKVEWAAVVDQLEHYKVSSDILAHQFINPTNLAAGFGRHQLTFQIANQGNLVLKNLTIFGFLYNQQGQLVDMIWAKKGENIPAGQSLEILAPSVSQTGRCVGRTDPSGYTLEYFVDWEGVNGTPLAVHKVVAFQPQNPVTETEASVEYQPTFPSTVSEEELIQAVQEALFRVDRSQLPELLDYETPGYAIAGPRISINDILPLVKRCTEQDTANIEPKQYAIEILQSCSQVAFALDFIHSFLNFKSQIPPPQLTTAMEKLIEFYFAKVDDFAARGQLNYSRQQLESMKQEFRLAFEP